MSDAPFGVSLPTYAGITVALAEGHALEAVLAEEAVALDAWRAAEPRWKIRLAASAARGDAEFTAFRARTLEAEDALARRIEPLDTELGAWLAFVRAWGHAPEPAAFLEERGLSANDVSRLRRVWDVRFEEQPALALEAARRLARGELGPVPPLHVAAKRLVPFPWSKGRVSHPSWAPAAAGSATLDRDARYLAAHRRAQEAMTPPARAPLASPSAPARLEPARLEPARLEPMRVASSLAPSLDSTSPLLTAVTVEPLPFVTVGAAVPPPSSPPQAPHPNLGATVELGALTDDQLVVATTVNDTAILDASALGDLDAASPFPLPQPPRR
jgi:hypothetical protein